MLWVASYLCIVIGPVCPPDRLLPQPLQRQRRQHPQRPRPPKQQPGKNKKRGMKKTLKS